MSTSLAIDTGTDGRIAAREVEYGPWEGPTALVRPESDFYPRTVNGQFRVIREGAMRAKDIMHAGAATFGEHETLTAAARLMHDTGVGMLPIVGEDHQLLYKMRRLPVVDQHHLLGIISEADIARHLPEDEIAPSVKAICAP